MLVALFLISAVAQAQVLNPDALPLPPARTHFDVPETDPAGVAARLIARRIPTFRNYRAEIPLATWVHDNSAAWAIRGTEDCYQALEALQVPFERIPSMSPLVPSPVRISSPVDGISFGTIRISCELALRLPQLARILRKYDLVRVVVMSHYRDHPRTSFHTMGLALDLATFFDSKGTRYRVQDHFVATPQEQTCLATPPSDSRARVLLQLACDLFESRLLSSVLTPNYNEGHRDHFHIDIRPDDPRLFLR
jgi:hypothetical protein